MIPLHKIAKEKRSLNDIDVMCIRYLRFLGYDRFKRSSNNSMPNLWDLRFSYDNHWVRAIAIRNFIVDSTRRPIDLPPFNYAWIVE